MNSHATKVISRIFGGDVHKVERPAIRRHLDVEVPPTAGTTTQVSRTTAIARHSQDLESLTSQGAVAALAVILDNSIITYAGGVKRDVDEHAVQATSRVPNERYLPRPRQI